MWAKVLEYLATATSFTLAPGAVYGLVAIPRAAVLVVFLHRHVMNGTEVLALVSGRRLRRHGKARQDRLEPRQQPALIAVAQGQLHLPAGHGDMTIHRGWRLWQGRRRVDSRRCAIGVWGAKVVS